VVRNNDSDCWAAPIEAIFKPNWAVRICVGFNALNEQLQIVQRPLPSLDCIMERLQSGQYFSKMVMFDASI